MKITEVFATTQPLPYRWVNGRRAAFDFKGTTICVEFDPLDYVTIGQRSITGLNIAFGTVKNDEDDINFSITGLQGARTVLATVAKIILDGLQKLTYRKYTYVTLMSKPDEAMSARTKIYQAGVIDVADKAEKLGFEYPCKYRGRTSDILFISKIPLTPQDADYINKTLKLDV